MTEYYLMNMNKYDLGPCLSLNWVLGGWCVLNAIEDIVDVRDEYRYFGFEIKNSAKINFVDIVCHTDEEDNDFYSVNFYYRSPLKSTLIRSYQEVCADRLLDLIEIETGLDVQAAIKDFRSKCYSDTKISI